MKRQKWKQQGGFTLTEATLSVVLFSLMIGPFIVFYGTGQSAMTMEMRATGSLMTSRLTMDQVLGSLHHVADPNSVVLADSQTLCYQYQALANDGSLKPTTSISYRYDASSQTLMVSRDDNGIALTDLPAFCNSHASETPVGTQSGSSRLAGFAFTYYLGSAVVTTPTVGAAVNFNRIGVTVAFAQPSGTSFVTQSSVAMHW